jgi:DNA replication protein DnaC
MADADFSEILGISSKDLKEGARLFKMNRGIGCTLCDYSGYTINYKGKAVMCSCEKERFFKKLYRQSNVPQLYFGKTLDDWNTRTDSLGRDLGNEEQVSQKVITLLKFYEKYFERICQGDSPRIKHTGNIVAKLHSILFDGKSGSGKTFIASAMVQSAIRKNLTSKYYEWSDLISVITDFDKNDEVEKINEEFKNLDFVVIDGIEQYSYTHPLFIQNLDRLVKSRLNSGKPIFLMILGSTSNISTGSGWNSLIQNCLTIRLPHIR